MLQWDEQAEALYGWTGAEARGRPLQRLLRLDAAAIDRVVASSDPRGTGGAIDGVARDGTAIRVIGWIAPGVDARGRRIYAGIVAPDAELPPAPPPGVGDAVERLRLLALERAAHAEAVEAASGVRRLHRLAAALSRAGTTADVARVIVDEALATTAAHGAMLFALDGGELRLVARAGFAGEPEPSACVVPLAANLPMTAAVRSRSPVWLRSEAERDRLFPDYGNGPYPRRSFAALPLVAEHGCIGTLGLAFTEERAFFGEDESHLLALAGLAAQALERAAAFETERRERARAEVTADRLQRLQRLGDALAGALTPGMVYDAVVAEAVTAAGAEAGSIAVLHPGGDVEVVRAVGYHPDLLTRFGRLPAGSPLPLAEAAASGAPVFVPRIDDLPEEHPLRRAAGRERRAALAALPVRVAGATTAAIGLSFAETHTFDDDERAFLCSIAAQCAVALERSRLYEREHNVAEGLQRAVLPDALPSVPGISIAARYLPAASSVDVGGDWYDAFVLRDGRLAFAIGDVTGHGLRAASTMGRLRNGLLAYALDGGSPANVLRRVNRFLLDAAPDATASAVYAVLDPDGTLSWASAGHPPPLHLGPRGERRWLEAGPTILLGVDPQAAFVDQTVPLAPGAGVVLYTDGLVERRGEPIDAGLARLASALAGAPDAAAACDAALLALGAERHDDVCVLAVVRAGDDG